MIHPELTDCAGLGIFQKLWQSFFEKEAIFLDAYHRLITSLSSECTCWCVLEVYGLRKVFLFYYHNIWYYRQQKEEAEKEFLMMVRKFSYILNKQLKYFKYQNKSFKILYVNLMR